MIFFYKLPWPPCLFCSLLFFLFNFELIITTFLSFISYLQTLLYTPPNSPSNSWLHFSLIIMARMYLYICVCVFVLKYNLSLYNVFKTDQIFPREWCLSLWQLLFVAYSCVGLRSHRLYPLHFIMSICVVLARFTLGQSCWWDYGVGLASDILEDTSHFIAIEREGGEILHILTIVRNKSSLWSNLIFGLLRSKLSL